MAVLYPIVGLPDAALVKRWRGSHKDLQTRDANLLDSVAGISRLSYFPSS